MTITIEDLLERIEKLETTEKIQHKIERIAELEKQLKALTDMYKEISINHVSLIDHKIRQVYENRNLSRRIEDIEDKLNKKTYKCPVCLGEGSIKQHPPLVKDDTTYFFIPCNVCKKKDLY